MNYVPVCCQDSTGKLVEYANACMASAAGATIACNSACSSCIAPPAVPATVTPAPLGACTGSGRAAALLAAGFLVRTKQELGQAALQHARGSTASALQRGGIACMLSSGKLYKRLPLAPLLPPCAVCLSGVKRCLPLCLLKRCPTGQTCRMITCGKCQAYCSA